MDKLKSEYTNFRERIFCQDIDASKIKQFSDRIKQQLTSSESERYPFEVISLLESMYNHNKSINTGAAPTLDTVHLFDLNLTLNQLQSLKRCIQKLDYPQQILDSLDFLFSFMFSDDNNKLFLINCKIINDILAKYKKILKLKNEEYQLKSIKQIELLLEYGKKNNSPLLTHHLETNGISKILKQLSTSSEVLIEIKQQCSELLQKYVDTECDSEDFDSEDQSSNNSQESDSQN
ncbi:hypothetical protein ABPG72_000411 [Tetrahymena utriculariae]